MSRKTEYVHNPCFLSANILKILGVFAENQKEEISRCKENNNTNNMLCDRSVYFVANNYVAIFLLRRFLCRRIMVKISLTKLIILYD